MHMGSDSSRLKSAVNNHKYLLRQGSIGAPQTEAKAGIVCSYGIAQWKERRIFRREAYAIADSLMQQGFHGTELAIDATGTDYLAMLEDPAITDIVTIGHGSLSELNFTQRDYDYAIDWRLSARSTGYLKTGQFIQRMCGHYSRRLNIPLGTFVVQNQMNVIASDGEYFQPSGLDHPQNTLLTQMFPRAVNSAQYMIDRFLGQDDDDSVLT